MSDSKFPRPGSRRGLWGILLLALATLVAGVAWWFWPRPDWPRLKALRNEGLAFLENYTDKSSKGALAKASANFTEIVKLRSGDPLGHRNLAISALLDLTSSQDNSVTAQLFDAAQQAVDALVRVEPSSASTHLIRARLALVAGDRQLADSAEARKLAWLAIQAATDLDPQDPALWYQMYQIGAFSELAEVQEQARAALGKAVELAPRNLYVLTELLNVQIDAQDRGVETTLTKIRAFVNDMPRVAASIEGNPSVEVANLDDYVDGVIRAAKDGNWAEVRPARNKLGIPLRSLMYLLGDQRAIDKHSLNYVLTSFQGEPPTSAVASAPAAVSFLAAPLADLPDDMGSVDDLHVVDFDLDRRWDLVILAGGRITAFTQSADGSRWTPLTSAEIPSGISRILLADLDQDGLPPGQSSGEGQRLDSLQAEVHHSKSGVCLEVDLDVLAYGPGGVAILANELDAVSGRRSLVPVKQTDALTSSNVLAAALGDVYADGDLDLVLSTPTGISLWCNLGNSQFIGQGQMKFAELGLGSQMPPADIAAGAIKVVDWDFDVDLDILLAAADGKQSGYLENLRHGLYRFVPFSGPEVSGSTDMHVLDANHDSQWELLTGGPGGLRLHAVGGAQVGAPQLMPARGAIAPDSVTGLCGIDFNNDGHDDLVTWHGSSIQLYAGDGRGGFATQDTSCPPAAGEIHAIEVVDFDRDGDEDLVIGGAGGCELRLDQGGNAQRWLDVRLRSGRQEAQELPFRVNAHGLGSVIQVRAGDLFQQKLVEEPLTHFGLGTSATAETIRVVWTNGIPQNIINPAADQEFCEEQILGGSCPYLYIWNGERFEFLTDCLWAAPLGLQQATGQFAPARSWEYLKIPGDRFQPKNGRYSLQLTEELWEACYLDELRLLAVDHPQGVQVFSNEKVGPAAIAEHKIHTARNLHSPVAAHDQRGRDVLDQVVTEDGRYLKAFEATLSHGLTKDEHFLQLDLGQLEDPRQITLFLTGWMFPTNTSLNIAITEHPQVEPPRAPSLWVPDANGQWVEALPFMGFPGGKTKTIAVDMSGLFPTADHRLQIRTTMQIYWDWAAFTVDETPAETLVTELPLVSADLHYRGFSRRLPGVNNGPDRFDYDDVDVRPKWPSMEGRFTRYGEVKPLLTRSDDMLVVFGAGDELTLEFDAGGRPIGEGWERDFLIYNVGWDKDADLNTAFGQSVEPLPFHAMSGYPWASHEAEPDTPPYLEYLRTYQTRTQYPAAFWKQLLAEPIITP